MHTHTHTHTPPLSRVSRLRVCQLPYSTRIRVYIHTHVPPSLTAVAYVSYSKTQMHIPHMGWLRLVGSIRLQVSFAEHSLFYRALLQKRLIILSMLLTEAIPYTCTYTYTYTYIRTSLSHEQVVFVYLLPRPTPAHTPTPLPVHTHTITFCVIAGSFAGIQGSFAASPHIYQRLINVMSARLH